MSSSMNQQPGSQAGLAKTAPLWDTAPSRQTVVEDIDRYLEDGMPVYDRNGEKVGDVQRYSTAAGYLMLGSGALDLKNLYIPFRLIRSIDPHDIFLTEPKDTLAATYTEPPKISTVVENRLVPGPGGAMTTQTREVQMVQSGYDGKPTAVASVDVRTVADRLAVGMVVYDADGERLGDLTQYDTARSLLVVEKGVFKPRVLFVPFGAIQDIDLGTFCVYLSLPADVLIKEHAMLPGEG